MKSFWRAKRSAAADAQARSAFQRRAPHSGKDYVMKAAVVPDDAALGKVRVMAETYP
jgi:hypothetical protein